MKKNIQKDTDELCERRHTAKLIEFNGMQAEIDNFLVDVILALWHLGKETFVSCQGGDTFNYKSNTFGFIGFNNKDDAIWFYNLKPIDGIIIKNRWRICAAINNRFVVHFPQEDITFIEEQLAKIV